MIVEVFIGDSPTCSAVPRVMSLVKRGNTPHSGTDREHFFVSLPSSMSCCELEQDGYDPFSSALGKPENGSVELKNLCLTAISSEGSGIKEHQVFLGAHWFCNESDAHWSTLVDFFVPSRVDPQDKN